MIFVTVGTQLHFDRLIAIVDLWASKANADVFCQTGESSINFKACKHSEFISPSEFEEYIKNCEILVAHAGIGSILSAIQYNKPIIIFPRKASLNEHRNEHQLSTARKFEGKPGIYVAYNEQELVGLLNKSNNLLPAKEEDFKVDDELILEIEKFIND